MRHLNIVLRKLYLLFILIINTDYICIQLNYKLYYNVRTLKK